MATKIWRWMGLSLVIAATGLACSGEGEPGGSDGGEPDAFVEDATGGDGTLFDGGEAGREDAADAGDSADAREDATEDVDAADGGDTVDAGRDADAADGNGEDGGDAGASDADTSDEAGTDASDAAGDASDGAIDGDAGDASLDAGPTFVVTSCWHLEGVWSSEWIDSAGNRYKASGQSPPPAGLLWPPGTVTPYSTLSAADLAALISAAKTLDVSTDGYTTTIGPNVHNNAREGDYYSAGTLRDRETLVVYYEDGITVGHKKVISANDPAANVIRKYQCFVID